MWLGVRGLQTFPQASATESAPLTATRPRHVVGDRISTADLRDRVSAAVLPLQR